ncbi:MAG TPA: Mur ligase family protein [Patescibacteria group bacterium]|nr:Mur ligase family protein [Patescibacteria group bacterium]
MLHTLKKRLYFVVAAYFAFWAKFVLRRWKPRIVVITGSSGKTSVLHIAEAQMGTQAIYSHHANSAIGIPFHVLGMEPNVSSKADWLVRLVAAPFNIFRSLPPQKLYVVEADSDRPHEGNFIANFLKPEVTIWVSLSHTHSMNFDSLVKNGTFPSHEAAIAKEFSDFVAATTKLVLANGDQPELVRELARAKRGVEVKQLSTKAVTNYELTSSQTIFTIGGQKFTVPGLHPKEVGIGLQMISELTKYFDLPSETSYTQLKLPPGRSNILKGIKNTTIIDSTYNNGLGAVKAILELYKAYPAEHKWLVIADILEQGSLESDEHKRLAEEISKISVDRVVLLGKRTHEYSYPTLKDKLPEGTVVSFVLAGEVLDYLQKELKGGETILFKGAQGLEGVIEQLLADPKDAKQLVRRGTTWTKRRQAWGLPR